VLAMGVLLFVEQIKTVEPKHRVEHKKSANARTEDCGKREKGTAQNQELGLG
jgi:hypothetical protein